VVDLHNRACADTQRQRCFALAVPPIWPEWNRRLGKLSCWPIAEGWRCIGEAATSGLLADLEKRSDLDDDEVACRSTPLPPWPEGQPTT